MERQSQSLRTSDDVASLRRRIAELEEDNTNLRLMLETTTAHGDVMEDALVQEKDDLQLLIDTTTAHSDFLEEELFNRAEDALRETERKLRLIVDVTPVPIFVSRAEDAVVVFSNNLGGPLLGIEHHQVVGVCITDFLLDGEERARVRQQLAQEGAVNHAKVQLRRASGERRWIDLSIRRLEYGTERYLLSAWNDITGLVELNEAFARFVPAEWLVLFDKKTVGEMQLGDHIAKQMTVMFSDLRSFTSMSEKMSPEQCFDFINEYYSRVSPPVIQNKGVIVKYLADGMMAVFPEIASNAVEAGLEQLRAVKRYNRDREAEALEPIRIGVGVNTGAMMVGLVGNPNRIQGDAISDAVNLTARIEALTAHYGVSLLMTDATRRNLGDSSRYHIRFVDKVRVRGKSVVLELFEVFSEDQAEQIDLKEETRADYEAAMRYYYDGAFDEAQARLFRVLQRNPSDKVAWRHLVRATRWLDEGAAADWSATVILEK